jgi:hypothetical protein
MAVRYTLCAYCTFNSINFLQITVVLLQCNFEAEMNQINVVLAPAKVGQILIHCLAFGLTMDRGIVTF